MTKTKSKLVIIIPSAIGAVVLFFIIYRLFSPFLGSAGEHIRKSKAVRAAQNGVESYFYEKYGEYPEITDIEPEWRRYGYIIPIERHFTGYVTLKEKSCTIYYFSETNSFYDSKQYDEICAALTEKYFTDEKLGSDVYADVDMCFSNYWEYGDHEEAKCTNTYFDGDIDKFFQRLPYNYSLSADIYYSGKEETGRACRELISDKLDELSAKFPNGNFSVNIKNTESSFEFPTALTDSFTYYGLPAEYGALIAKGIHRQGGENEVYYTEWCSLDEYVSMADITSEAPPERSDLFFRTDNSYNGISVFTDPTKDESMTLMGDAYIFQNLNSKHIFIRLDRKKFNVGYDSIPIILCSSGELCPYYIGNRSVGSPYLQTMPDSWYIYDENYIYIYVYSNEAIIMFTGKNGI